MTQQRPLHEALAILDPPTLTTVSESFIKFSEIFDSIMIKTLSLKVELIFIYKYNYIHNVYNYITWYEAQGHIGRSLDWNPRQRTF